MMRYSPFSRCGFWASSGTRPIYYVLMIMIIQPCFTMQIFKRKDETAVAQHVGRLINLNTSNGKVVMQIEMTFRILSGGDIKQTSKKSSCQVQYLEVLASSVPMGQTHYTVNFEIIALEQLFSLLLCNSISYISSKAFFHDCDVSVKECFMSSVTQSTALS